MQTVKLNNGVEMPILGYGVFQVSPEECERCVLDAISVGYRLIDTAQAYYNEEGVGNAVAKCGVPRNELFLTTKVWITNAGEEKAAASIDESLRKLRTDYIDLLLIHQPFSDYTGTWRAMERAVREGKVRAIGLSNFYPDRFVDMAEYTTIKPAVNQLKTNVFSQQMGCRGGNEALQYAHHGLGTVGTGRPGLAEQPDAESFVGKVWQDSSASGLALPPATRHHRHSQEYTHGAHEAESGRVRLRVDSRRNGEHPSAGQTAGFPVVAPQS